nr:UPF0235 protein C15orf40 homolog isoform X3 [Equus asinus]
MRPQAPAAGALLPPAGLYAPLAAAGAGRCLALRALCRSLQSVFPGRYRSPEAHGPPAAGGEGSGHDQSHFPPPGPISRREGPAQVLEERGGLPRQPAGGALRPQQTRPPTRRAAPARCAQAQRTLPAGPVPARGAQAQRALPAPVPASRRGCCGRSAGWGGYPPDLVLAPPSGSLGAPRCRRKLGKSESKKPETSLPPLGPVAADPKGCVTIAIHAKPGSKQNAVTDVTAEAVSVAIAAPPSEGEANAELCRYLSKVLDLRKSDVVLDKGGKSREKVVKLLASTTPDEILEKLKKEVEKK